MKVLLIAVNTFRESIRDKILYTTCIFGLLLIGSSYILSPLAVGARHKMVADVGLAAISILGVMILLLVGSAVIHREVDRRLIFIILARPVSRFQYLAGKFGGIVLTLGTVVLIMTALYLLVLMADGIPLRGSFLVAVWLTFLELTVLTAVTVFFSSFTNSTLTSLFTLSFFVMGHLSGDLRAFAERVGGGATKVLCEVLFYALPNLEAFNARTEAVHGLEIKASDVGMVTLYAVVYVAFCLAASGFIFARRDFK